MRNLGNILWHFPLMGFMRAFAMLISGCACCLTIVLIPVGLGQFQLAKFYLWPFDRAVVTRQELAMLSGRSYSPDGLMAVLNVIARILYFIPGCVAVVSGAVAMVGEFASIIGIPAGLVESRILRVYFNPINKVCVPREVGDQIKMLKQRANINRYSAPGAAPGTAAAPGFTRAGTPPQAPPPPFYSETSSGTPPAVPCDTPKPPAYSAATTAVPVAQTQFQVLADRVVKTLSPHKPGAMLLIGVAFVYLAGVIANIIDMASFSSYSPVPGIVTALFSVAGVALILIGLADLLRRSKGDHKTIWAVLGVTAAIQLFLIIFGVLATFMGIRPDIRVVEILCTAAMAGVLALALTRAKSEVVKYGCLLLIGVSVVELLGIISGMHWPSILRVLINLALLAGSVAGWALLATATYEESDNEA